MLLIPRSRVPMKVAVAAMAATVQAESGSDSRWLPSRIAANMRPTYAETIDQATIRGVALQTKEPPDIRSSQDLTRHAPP